jgi:hypothetical protein
LTRASTPFSPRRNDVDGRVKPGHDDRGLIENPHPGIAAVTFGFPEIIAAEERADLSP